MLQVINHHKILYKHKNFINIILEQNYILSQATIILFSLILPNYTFESSWFIQRFILKKANVWAIVKNPRGCNYIRQFSSEKFKVIWRRCFLILFIPVVRHLSTNLLTSLVTQFLWFLMLIKKNCRTNWQHFKFCDFQSKFKAYLW